MSPSWHSRLYVAISPDRLSMIKLGRGLRPRVQARHNEAIVPAGHPLWQPALERLAQLLSQPEWQKAEVNVVLSNRLARFSTIVFGQQLKNYSAQEAYARHVLGQTYGAGAEKWVLRIQRGRAGEPCVVCAMDRALLDSLQQACAAQKLKLNQVTPYLVPVFNRFKNTFQKDPAWLVVNEPGYSLLALVSKGGFVAINGASHESLDELPVLLDRENLVNASPEPCQSVYLHAPFSPGVWTVPTTAYEFGRLDLTVPGGFPAVTEGLHAMTMSEFL